MSKEIDPKQFTNKTLEELRFASIRKKKDRVIKPIPFSEMNYKKFNPIPVSVGQFKVYLYNEWSKIIDQIPIIHPNNIEVLDNLTKYFLKLPGAFNLRKGIYLVGEYGSGKTVLMYAIKETLKYFNHNNNQMYYNYLIKEYSQIKKNVGAKDLTIYLEQFNNRHLCIDDLGYEEDDKNKNVNDYGTVINMVQELVRERYRVHGYYTHFTGNKSFGAIENLYGRGTSTRLTEICTEVFWDGGSLRK